MTIAAKTRDAGHAGHPWIPLRLRILAIPSDR